MFSEIEDALHLIRTREHRTPEIALVLGSGLGRLVESASDLNVISTTEIPGYPRSTVQGHEGRLVFGRMQGRDVLFFQGRVHLYEGHPLSAVTLPVRLAFGLGARNLVVTNAAGGINPLFKPGTLMLITGHINMAFEIPPSVRPFEATYDPRSSGGRAGDGLGLEPRVGYDAEWLKRVEVFALRNAIQTRRGVYLWTRGPSYETKAEIRMFARLGADAVGMSTVPEVIQAGLLGMRVLGVSTITNPAAGLGSEPLAHEDVLAVGRTVRRELEVLLHGIIKHA